MADWDDDEWDQPKTTPSIAAALPTAGSASGATGGAWDDEEEEDWEGGGSGTKAGNEEEVEAEKMETFKKKSAPMKPKKALELAVRQREAAEREKETQRILAREEALSKMSEAERKLDQQRLVEEADLANAKDLFSITNISSDNPSPSPPSTTPSLDTFVPSTDDEYQTFADMLSKRITPLNDNPRQTARYVGLLKTLLRQLSVDLGPDDAKDLSTFAGLLSNEKRDAFKKAHGYRKKANNKASLRVSRPAHHRGQVDEDLRDDFADDFADDFM